MALTSQIECGADALRRFEMRGRMLRDWRELPSSTKKKWMQKAEVVLDAARREGDRLRMSKALDVVERDF